MLCVAPLAGQQRSVGTAATFHREPGGTVLAAVPAGATVTPRRTRGDWAELTLDGWVRSAGVTVANRDGFDLVVSTRNGEELRAAPSRTAEAEARLRYGALLDRVETRGDWVRVRRVGWIARSALAAAPAAAPARPPAAGAGAQAPDTAAQRDTAPAPVPRDTTPVREGGATRVATARAAPLHAAPEGGRLGSLQAGAPARVLTRADGWVRVQVEGWVRDEDLVDQTGDDLVGVSAAELRAEPERFVGQIAVWRVQFIALRVADELRPEIPAGEPYLLTRGPLPEAGFVYVVIPRDMVQRFRELQPLTELRIRATIRAPRTRHLPTPVVELRSFEVAGG